jgi:methylmalonyl-CoA mutase cobalamin-binding subunit/DNA-binding transcriptional MerR regulator
MSTQPPPSTARPRHPIAVVAQRTGLSQDVLRVWERRYEAVTPGRSESGVRLYSDADIERLILLRAATRGGRGIGQVATLSTRALETLVAEDEAAREKQGAVIGAPPEPADVVGTSIALARQLDAPALDDILRRAAVIMGMPVFLETVAAPLLRKVGEEWHAGRLSPAHEHLVTSSLHEIVVAMMRAFAHRPGAPTVLVTTSAGERHVIGAALVGAAAALEGWNVLYLGANLPAGEIADAAKSTGVRVVAVSIIYVESASRVRDEMRALREQLPDDVPLIAGGAGAVSMAKELAAMNIRVKSSVSGFLSELRRDTIAP